MPFYIDTSALVKTYWEEKGSEFVHELSATVKKRDEKIYTAMHTIVELGSAAMRLVREKTFTQDEASGIIDCFKRGCFNSFSFIHLNQILLYKALDMLVKYPLKAADAMHLACASDACGFLGPKDFCFVSDDVRLCDAADKEGMIVLRPGEDSATAYLKNLT